MGLTVGFEQFPKDWEGPVVLEFRLSQRGGGYSYVVRYECPIGDRRFDLYAPYFMVHQQKGSPPPERLLVAIGKTSRPGHTLGFGSTPINPVAESNEAEFTFKEEKVNSYRFDLDHEGYVYGLYVPRAIFGADPPPTRLFLRTALPT